MRYSTYLFDAGGTLIKFDHAKLARIYAERAGATGLRVSLEQAQSVLEALELEVPVRTGGQPLSLDPKRARQFWIDFWAEGFRRLGVPGVESLAMTEELLPRLDSVEFESAFPDAAPALDALRAEGAQLGVVSNFSGNLEDLLRVLGLHPYFAFFVVSALAGVEKPDPQIFELAVQAVRVPKRDVVYVGDSPFHDVQGARAAGLDAILIDRTDRYPGFQGKRIRSLLDLAEGHPLVQGA
jgi:putative hydrolase of the HAD superfamily